MRFFNGFFIFVFISMLAIPLVFVDLESDRISVIENRTLANRPFFSGIKNNPGMFVRQFDDWFKDSIGFREKLINLYRKTDNIFGQNYYLDGTSIVLIGKQGHHFHTNNNRLLQIYQGKRWLDDVQLNELSNKLNDIQQYLSEKNIPFIVMLCADKESIYPEYYPDFVIRGPEPTSLDAVVEYLSTHTNNLDFFCIKERFLREKEDFLLYPKTGNGWELLHYNETGSFIAYQELMKHIIKYFPDLEPFTLKNVNITYSFNGSSNVTLKQEKNYEQTEARFFSDAIEFENKNSSLPTLLFLRDSYADFFPNYLPQHFSRTTMLHNRTLEYFKVYIYKYKPDIIVFESAERTIPEFANYVIGISEVP